MTCHILIVLVHMYTRFRRREPTDLYEQPWYGSRDQREMSKLGANFYREEAARWNHTKEGNFGFSQAENKYIELRSEWTWKMYVPSCWTDCRWPGRVLLATVRLTKMMNSLAAELWKKPKRLTSVTTRSSLRRTISWGPWSSSTKNLAWLIYPPNLSPYDETFGEDAALVSRESSQSGEDWPHLRMGKERARILFQVKAVSLFIPF